MNSARKLPVGIQSFEKLRSEAYLYVDKTAFVWNLVQTSSPYFLSRPRRFGKSLLLSTIEAYFLGKKELFAGLKIVELEASQKTVWKSYPVIRLDFNAGQYDTVEALINTLDFQLAEYEKKYGASSAKDLPSRFSALINSAYSMTGEHVVVLVDEYDKPLLSTQYINEALNEKYRTILKGLYGVLKTDDAHLRFVFLTGVSQFSRLSIFSDMNQFRNISMEDGFSEICGITEAEVTQYFKPEIKSFAEKNNFSFDKAVSALRIQYDGYRFAENGKHLYNPFSLLNCLATGRIENYWYQTGTPTFLINVIKSGNFDIRTLDHTEEIGEDTLRNSEANPENPIPILFQSGYLTLKEFNSEFRSYSLGFPNAEVKYAFLNNLLPEYLDKKSGSTFFVGTFVKDLREGNIESFMKRITAMISKLPYSTEAKTDREMRERDYHLVFYLVFTLMGQYTLTEVHSLKGRADCIVETLDCVYIFEFKLLQAGTPEDAIRQIKEKGYAEPYRMNGKAIKLIGVAFDEKTENLSDWKVEKV